MTDRMDGPILVEADERFRLTSDDDGHYYVIPADKSAEWEKWVYSDGAMDGEEPPKWALPVGGSPSGLLTFTDPRIE